jgi:hypothetical protein
LARSVLCLSCKNHEIMSDMTRSSYKHIYFVCCPDPNFFFIISPFDTPLEVSFTSYSKSYLYLASVYWYGVM